MVRRVGFPRAFLEAFPPFRQPVGLFETVSEYVWRPRGRAVPGDALHWFVDDYRQEFAWRRPEEGLAVSAFAPVCTGPDYTVWLDDPLNWRVYQVWRSRLVCEFWSSRGLSVLPVLPLVVPDGLPTGLIRSIRGPSKRESGWVSLVGSAVRRTGAAGLVVFGNAVPDGTDLGCPVVRLPLFGSYRKATAQKEVKHGW